MRIIVNTMTHFPYSLLILWLISETSSSPRNNGGSNEHRNILVFGGNGFIGANTVENLVRVNYTVVIINRGNWYWDSAFTVKPYVKHIACDRMQSLQRCAGLQHYIWSPDSPVYFDAIVDFSAYHAFEITEALDILRGKALKYIYISSDSVYEVSNKTHSGFSREEDAVRPDSIEEQEILRRKDSYGHRKLECEEVLQKQAEDDGGIPYIALRLPDVVGPRDNTYRWWLYQLWIKINSYLDKQLSVPRIFWDQPMSFVYVKDVADVILDCITGDPEINNQAFNLALDEMPTLVQYLHSLMDILDVADITIHEDTSEEAFHLFPSVKSGPVDTTKAKQLLGWNPSPWIDVLDNTVKFYEEAMMNDTFETAKKDVVRTLQQHFSKNPVHVLEGVNEVYRQTFLARDEL